MKVYNGIGPVIIDPDSKKLVGNPKTITKEFHLLSIDAPCGIGFQLKTGRNCFVNNEDNSTKATENSLDRLANQIALGLNEFFNYDKNGCTLRNLFQLKMYIWSEGLGSLLAVKLRKAMEATVKQNDIGISISGIILGDPLIDIIKQHQNFASYASGRSLGTNDLYRSYLQLETLLQVIEQPSSATICQLYQLIFAKFNLNDMCPFDVQTSCPSVQQFISATSNCEFFPVDPIETDLDNPLLRFLRDKLGVMQYVANTTRVFRILQSNGRGGSQDGVSSTYLDLFDPSATDQFAEAVNNTKVLLYQSQNNFLFNSISLMLYADALRWRNYADFIQQPTQSILLSPPSPSNRYTMRHFGNYYKAQIFGIGGLYTYRNIYSVLRDNLFSNFVRD